MMTEKEKFLHSVLWHHSAVKQASRRTENQTWLPAGGTPMKVTVQSKEERGREAGKEGEKEREREGGGPSEGSSAFPVQIKSSSEKRRWKKHLQLSFHHTSFVIQQSDFHIADVSRFQPVLLFASAPHNVDSTNPALKDIYNLIWWCMPSQALSYLRLFWFLF